MSDAKELSKADVSKLAELARIELDEAEKTELLKDLKEIIGYVQEIQSVDERAQGGWGGLEPRVNVLRDDEVANEPGEYTEKILAEAPAREDDLVKVKKILSEE